MWPFEKHASAVDLAAITTPTPVDVEVRVTSSNDVASPVTGVLAAAFVIEVVSRHFTDDSLAMRATEPPEFRWVGTTVVGDRITLAGTDDVAIVALVRRTAFVFVTETTGGHPLATAPPELVPLLGRVPLGGTACFREHAISEGDRWRLRAMVERATAVVPTTYRTEARSVLVVRDDLGPATLEEIFDAKL